MAAKLKTQLAAQLADILQKSLNYESPLPVVASAINATPNKCSEPQYRISLERLAVKENKQMQEIADQLRKELKSPFMDLQQENTNSITLKVNRATFVRNVLEEIYSQSDFWLNSPLFADFKRQKIVIEFSSPNIAKPFHAGHLRSTIIGNFIANFYTAMGHRAVKVNYLGDWGAHIGVLLEGLKVTENSDINNNKMTLSRLVEIYVQANDRLSNDPQFALNTRRTFQNLESRLLDLSPKGGAIKDPDVESWEEFRRLTLEELISTYGRLNVHFDVIQSESEFAPSARVVCQELLAKGECSEDGGAVVTHYESGDKIKKVPLMTSGNATLYLTRDLAAILDRRRSITFDKHVYVTEKAQTNHFAALFAILEQRLKVPWVRDLRHVTYGRVHGMSTRRGNVVLLRDILDEAKQRARSSMLASSNTRVEADDDSASDILGMSSVIINDFKSRRNTDYAFDWDRVTSIKGDTGVFLQYAHSRLCSLEERVRVPTDASSASIYEFGSLAEPEALSLVSQLARFDEVMAKTYLDLEPCYLTQYLFRLAHCSNSALANLPVKRESNSEVARTRLLMFRCARSCLAGGLGILGIRALEKM